MPRARKKQPVARSSSRNLEYDSFGCKPDLNISSFRVASRLQPTTSLCRDNVWPVVSRTISIKPSVDFYRRIPETATHVLSRYQLSDWVMARVLHRGKHAADMVELCLEKVKMKHAFLYRAPALAIMVHDSLLFERLQNFASQHPHDIFDSQAMLFAVHLWYDLKKQLGCDNHRNRVLPNPLAVFIVYFEQWLRVHDEMSLTEHVHPYVFTNVLYQRDIATDSDFAINIDAIDEKEIGSLLEKTRRKFKDLTVTSRFPIVPAAADQIKMSYHRTRDYLELTSVEQGLIGFGTPWQYGFPLISNSASTYLNIAMPRLLANKKFCQTFRQLSNDPTQAPSYNPGDPNTAVDIFGPRHVGGIIWASQFPLILKAPTTTTVRRNPRLDKAIKAPFALRLHEIVSPEIQDLIVRRMRRHATALLQQGKLAIPEGARVEVTEEGLIYVSGMKSLEADVDDRVIPAQHEEVLLKMQSPVDIGPNNTGLSLVDRPTTLVPDVYVYELIATLGQRPMNSHITWGQCINEMQAGDRTYGTIYEQLKAAASTVRKDTDLLQRLSRDLSTEKIVVSKIRFLERIPMLMARLNNIDPADLGTTRMVSWDLDFKKKLMSSNLLAFKLTDLAIGSWSGKPRAEEDVAVNKLKMVLQAYLRFLEREETIASIQPTLSALQDFLDGSTLQCEWPTAWSLDLEHLKSDSSASGYTGNN
ncbi:hypothetical protein HJFPF1_02633 [Paramyrothecium foliicola]|nr:hypothetical protein HJFPF1_02633 [Paramyrothecium foliicola]